MSKKGMFVYRNGITYDGFDRTFFIEMTNSCRFNCSGCNIVKNNLKKIEISPNDFENIINIINIYMSGNKYCVGLGIGDFISTVSEKDLERYLKIATSINNDITLSVMGNYSSEIISDKKFDILKKFFDNTTTSIVLNPLMDNKNKEIFFKNIDNIKKIFDFRDVPLFLNLSSTYFKNNETIYKIKKFLIELKNKVELDKINSLTVIFNPNKLLIQKKEFQIDLKTQTEWYINFWNETKDMLNYITYDNIFSNYIRYNNIKILPHFIDKHTNFYISLEHIGDFPLNNLSGYKKIFNINELIKLDKSEILKIINNINYTRLKILLDNKKKLLKDNLCKNCEYIDFCSKQSIAINKEIYKNTLLGQETKDYCLGHKKLNDYIFNKFKNNWRNNE